MTKQAAGFLILCGIGAGCGTPGADDGDVVETQEVAASRAAAASAARTAPTVTVTSSAATTVNTSTSTTSTSTTSTSTASAAAGGAARFATVSLSGVTQTLGSPQAPELAALVATAESVTLNWTDRSSNETKFVVYRRDVQGNWQSVYTVPTTDMAGSRNSYVWVDNTKSLSAQCYYVAAVNDQYQSGTSELCTVRPDPAVYPQYPSAQMQQWWGLSNKNDTADPLYNHAANMYLQYEDRTFGVSLSWSENQQNNVKLERQGSIPQPLMLGEAVAIRVWGGGWLAHGIQGFGVDLVLSDTPVYEWYLVSGAPPGTTISSSAPFALWNRSAGDYLVNGDQTWSIGLNWYQKTLQPVDSPPSPPPGVMTFIVYNCHSDGRSVEMWVDDVTAGTGWVDKGKLDAEWGPSGGCPETGQPWIFTPTSGHSYIVRGIDFEASGCSNSPDINSCARSETTFVGDANGQAISTTID